MSDAVNPMKRGRGRPRKVVESSSSSSSSSSAASSSSSVATMASSTPNHTVKKPKRKAETNPNSQKKKLKTDEVKKSFSTNPEMVIDVSLLDLMKSDDLDDATKQTVMNELLFKYDTEMEATMHLVSQSELMDGDEKKTQRKSLLAEAGTSAIMNFMWKSSPIGTRLFLYSSFSIHSSCSVFLVRENTKLQIICREDAKKELAFNLALKQDVHRGIKTFFEMFDKNSGDSSASTKVVFPVIWTDDTQYSRYRKPNGHKEKEPAFIVGLTPPLRNYVASATQPRSSSSSAAQPRSSSSSSSSSSSFEQTTQVPPNSFMVVKLKTFATFADRELEQCIMASDEKPFLSEIDTKLKKLQCYDLYGKLEAAIAENPLALESNVFSFDALTGLYNCQHIRSKTKIQHIGLSMDLWYKDDVSTLGAIMMVQQKAKPILSNDVWRLIARFILPKQLLSLCRLPMNVVEKAVYNINRVHPPLFQDECVEIHDDELDWFFWLSDQFNPT